MKNNWQKDSLAKQKVYSYFLKKAKTQKQKYLEPLFTYHQEVTESVNCLDCGACCKNYSPRFKSTDIKRISKILQLKESAFIEKYLRIDVEGDYILNKKGCYFLNQDNTCSIYEDRPSDCKRFPYSDEDVFLERAKITLKNTEFCPIAYQVIEKLINLK